MRSCLKKYNEQVRIEKILNQTPAERIFNLIRSRTLAVGPVIDEKVPKFLMALSKKVDILVTELHQQPQMFYYAQVKICPLKTLKQHQCGDVVSSKDLDFGDELQQPEMWKSLKEQEKKQGSSIIFELLILYKNVTLQSPFCLIVIRQHKSMLLLVVIQCHQKIQLVLVWLEVPTSAALQ